MDYVNHLAGVLRDIAEHLAVFAAPMTSLPAWLADVAVNAYSHMRSAMYFADGRWRQWEVTSVCAPPACPRWFL
jgi:hypothetical protein